MNQIKHKQKQQKASGRGLLSALTLNKTVSQIVLPIFTLTSEPAMSAMLNNAPWITRTVCVTKAPRHEEIWDHKNAKFTRKLNLTTDTIYPRLTNNTCHTHTSKSTNGDYECTCYLNSCPIHHHLCSCIYPENTKVQCHCPLTCPLHTFPSMACWCVKWFCPFH